MKIVFLTCALLCVSLISGCSRSAGTQKIAAGIKQQPDGRQSREMQTQELRNQIEQIASAAKGRVGVAAMVLKSKDEGGRMRDEGTQQAVSSNHDEPCLVSLNPHEHFPMQSVYKLPIAMAVLKQVDAGKITLEQKVRVTKSDFVRRGQQSPVRDKYPNGAELTVSELLRFAISESDGTASDVLMKLAGGPEAVQAYLNDLGIKEMIVLNSEKEIGQDWQTQYRNWASPEAAVALLRALYERRGLSESSQA